MRSLRINLLVPFILLATPVCAKQTQSATTPPWEFTQSTEPGDLRRSKRFHWACARGLTYGTQCHDRRELSATNLW